MTTIQTFLGTVNYTDWLHVRLEKVSNPGVLVWETYIDVPVTNYTFIIPNLVADNYQMFFYDAPDTDSLGTLVSQCFVSALSSEFEYEVRFYTGGNLPEGATLDSEGKVLTDEYLIGKIIHMVYKEALRPIEPSTEWTNDTEVGSISLLGEATLANDEKLVVIIKNRVGSSSSSSGGLYSGVLTITDQYYSLVPTDRNKRVRLLGTDSTQQIYLPDITLLDVEDGFYFDNCLSSGGPIQTELLIAGFERIRFNGFTMSNSNLPRIWVSKGEHLLIRKFDDSYWEILSDYKGVNVGERIAAGYTYHPNTIPEDGRLMDGDIYGRLWWWLTNVVPNTHIVIDDDIVNPLWVQPLDRIGQFAMHSTAKLFRMPKTIGLSERGLSDFSTFGGDATRNYDYPGGFQPEMVGPHNHNYLKGTLVSNSDSGGSPDYVGQANASTSNNTGYENRVNNFGVIYLRRI